MHRAHRVSSYATSPAWLGLRNGQHPSVGRRVGCRRAIRGPGRAHPGDPGPPRHRRGQRGRAGHRRAQVDRVPSAQRSGAAGVGRTDPGTWKVPAGAGHSPVGQHRAGPSRPGRPGPAGVRATGAGVRRDGEPGRVALASCGQRRPVPRRRSHRRAQLGRPAHPVARHVQRQDPAGTPAERDPKAATRRRRPGPLHGPDDHVPADADHPAHRRVGQRFRDHERGVRGRPQCGGRTGARPHRQRGRRRQRVGPGLPFRRRSHARRGRGPHGRRSPDRGTSRLLGYAVSR